MKKRTNLGRVDVGIEQAAALVGLPPARMARLLESRDPAIRSAAQALVSGPDAARLRAFIARSRARSRRARQ